MSWHGKKLNLWLARAETCGRESRGRTDRSHRGMPPCRASPSYLCGGTSQVPPGGYGLQRANGAAPKGVALRGPGCLTWQGWPPDLIPLGQDGRDAGRQRKAWRTGGHWRAGRFWKQTIPGAALGTRDFVIALARRPLRMRQSPVDMCPCDWCDRSFWDDSLWGKQWLCLRNGGHSHEGWGWKGACPATGDDAHQQEVFPCLRILLVITVRGGRRASRRGKRLPHRFRHLFCVFSTGRAA